MDDIEFIVLLIIIVGYLKLLKGKIEVCDCYWVIYKHFTNKYHKLF